MAKYSYITDKTHNNRKIQVESAKRDGSGKNIENNYAKQNGNYQSLTAGLSNNFDTKLTEKDESAYNFRPTATMGSMELEVGSPCKVKKIVGGSVAFNQEVENGNFASVDRWRTYDGGSYAVSNNVATYTAQRNTSQLYTRDMPSVFGHKYFVSVTAKVPSGTKLVLSSRGQIWQDLKNFTNTSFETYSKIVTPYNSGYTYQLFAFFITEADSYPATAEIKNVMYIDLTQMFGSTIADYIYSLEQANAGSGIAWFKRYFPKTYYAYNSGELVSVKTQGKKITHFNQWDEEVKTGYYLDGTTGQEVASQNAMCSKNFCECMPNTSYYFRTSFVADATPVYFYDKDKNYISRVYVRNNVFITPTNAWYMRISFALAYGTTYNHDICINFHYDGERDGEYEPYNSETYPCDDVELRGIPQLDENNNLVFDGDEYLSDGNVTRKYGIVDLGTLNWNYNSSVTMFNASITNRKTSTNLICKLYTPYELNGSGSDPDMCMFVYEGTLYITNSSYTDSQTFKTAMSGVYLIYELATPTDENSIPFTEVQECDNWGTEEWLAPTTDTRPCEVPVGHETDYLPDLKAKLEVAPTTPNENGVYVMEHSASGNSYTPIATWLQANGYVNEISANAIKENIGGALRHQLAQANNIDFNNTAWVDLGTLNYNYDSGLFYAQIANLKPATSGNSTGNAICPLYKNVSRNAISNNMEMAVSTNNYINFKNSSYTDATTFKNAMKGILLVYEKAS